MELGYARGSAAARDLEQQVEALTQHGIASDRIYLDQAGLGERPEFGRLLGMARPGDTIVATTLDRLGHNLRECLTAVHDLRRREIGVKTLQDPVAIDTTGDATAELAVALLALFAEMDRVFMRERAAHARASAHTSTGPTGRQLGRRAGRPRKLTAGQLTAARAALDGGQHVDQVAEAVGVSRATLYRHLANHVADHQEDSDA